MERDKFKVPETENARNGKIDISEQDLRRFIYGLEMETFLKKKRYISM